MSSNIVIKLSLDDGNFQTKITSSRAELSKFKKAIGATDDKIKAAEHSTRSWGATLRDSVLVIGLARHALLNLDAVFFAMPRSIITASGELERMTQLMKGLSDVTTGYNDITKRAESDTKFVIDLSKASPFDINTITDSFVKYRSVGIDPTNGSLKALTDSVAKFGGSKEHLHRASVAIQQMAGKGVISMEEMRQQLAESVPDAMRLMSRGVGLSMGDLTDKISKGAVASTGALQAMFRQMAIENTGAAEEMSRTWTGLVNRLETQMTLFKKKIGEAGYFEEVKENLRFIVEDVLTSPEAANIAKGLGEGLRDIVVAISDTIKWMYEFKDEIVNVGTLMIGLAIRSKLVGRDFSGIAVGFSRMTGAMTGARSSFDNYLMQTKKVALAQKAIRVAGGGATNALKVQSLAMIRLRTAAFSAAAGMRALGASILALLGGPFGALLTAITVAIPLYDQLRDKHLEVMGEIDTNHPEFITKEQLSALEETTAKYDELIKRRDADKNSGEDAGTLAWGIFGFSKRWLNAQISEIQAAKDKLGGDEVFSQLIKDGQEADLKRSLDKVVRTIRNTSNKDLRGAISEYKKTLDKVFEAPDDTDNDERIKAENVLKATFKKHFDDRLKAARDFRDALDTQEKKATDKQKFLAQEEVDAIKLVRAEILKSFEMPTGGIEEQLAKVAAKDAKLLSSELKRLTGQSAKLQAKLKGSNEELAKFKALQSFDSSGMKSDAMTAAIEKILQSNDEIKKKIKANVAATKDFEKALKSIENISLSISNTFRGRENQNPFLKNMVSAENYRNKLMGVRDELTLMSGSDKEMLASVQALREIDTVLAGLNDKAKDASLSAFADQAEDIRISLLPEYDRIQGEHDKIIGQLGDWRSKQKEALSGDDLKKYTDLVDQLSKKNAKALQTPLENLVEKWADTTTRIQEIWASGMDMFVDTIVDGLVDGEFAFDEFAASFGKMILKMQVQAAAAGIITNLGNLLGGSSAPTPAPVTNVPSQPLYFANGGIMSGAGSMALKKYANGGIADRPQLALFGEGSMSEAYVPLPDGRSIPVTMSEGSGKGGTGDVHINIINQTDNGVTAEQQGGAKFDGEKMVLDVVLKNMNRAGGFRDSMRGAVK